MVWYSVFLLCDTAFGAKVSSCVEAQHVCCTTSVGRHREKSLRLSSITRFLPPACPVVNSGVIKLKQNEKGGAGDAVGVHIVALVTAMPVIVFPAAFIWYT